MRQTRYLLPTLKEDPADAFVSSHRLMIRAGLVRKESAGMYAYLPFGLRALRKVTDIVREEMDNSGAQEFLMPEMTSADLWKESGRWFTMGPEMFRIKDRNAQEYALGPTHEEAFTNMIRTIVSSYRDLPCNAYQINTKFRDEIRPRFGVIRSKEFIMKDAYSFDIDQAGLDESYNIMAATYRRIFDRCGLATIPVQADTGTMGGSASEEFMVASEVGEETLLLCTSCDYRANQEKAGFLRETASEAAPAAAVMEKVATPDVRTIDDLSAFFKTTAGVFLKSLIYVADGEPLMVVVTGDREINEVKLAAALGAAELALADDETVIRVTGAPVGFAGPVGIGLRCLFDTGVASVKNAITGANEKDMHYTNVVPGRDFAIGQSADIVSAHEGDGCPVCGKPMKETKGIEVGHIFKLGYKYTKAMNVTVLDKEGKAVSPIMGCYGIGVTRTLAAAVEQHHDEKGLVWPASIAPFQVHLVSLAKSDEEIEKTDAIYGMLQKAQLEVLYDDRKASPGVKFADSDLIGLPLRVTCGKTLFGEGKLEVKVRKSGEQILIEPENAAAKIRELLLTL